MKRTDQFLWRPPRGNEDNLEDVTTLYTIVWRWPLSIYETTNAFYLCGRNTLKSFRIPREFVAKYPYIRTLIRQ